MVLPNIEVERAKVAYAFWKEQGYRKEAICGLLASEEGESDFDPEALGDHKQAHGIFQWHIDRVNAMIKGCKIDVRTASHLDQLKAAHWEMTHGGEKRTGTLLKACGDLANAVYIMVHVYERSGSQASDIAKRTKYAQYWARMFINQ